jgi:hypothetical protein
MNDREPEDLLRRYRPAGPSTDLRARVMVDALPVGRTWPWVAAAAVLLAMVAGTHAWTHDTYHRVGRDLEMTSSSLDQLPALSAAIGDDELLRWRVAEALRLEEIANRHSQISAGDAWR